MKRITVLVFSLIFTMAFAGNAQVLKKLKRAATDGVQDAVERRVAHEIQKAAQKQTDRYMEQVFGPPTQYEGSGYDYSTVLNSMELNVEHADSYSFTGYTDMEITGTDSKGKDIDPTIFRSFSNQENETWGIRLATDDKDIETTTMIFDNEYQATVMLMESKKGEKSRMAYSMDWSGMMDAAMSSDSVSAEIESLEINKTGKTKTILGFECDEYHTETDAYESYYWVSREPIDGYASYWSKNNFMFSRQMKAKYQSYMDKLPDGDVLEISYFDKKGKETTYMKITEINREHIEVFDMEEYKNVMEEAE